MIFRELNNAKCKTYLLASESMERAVIIDPLKDRVERYLGVLAYHRLKLDLIVDTHTHADHRSGAHELSELTDTPVAMHRRAPAPHVTMHLEDGQRLIVGDFELKVLYTPGHTPDSISLYAEDRVFTGDCLLIHGTGRADFAGGDAGEQYDSITRKLFALPDSTLVYPAHDYRGHIYSTIGEEKGSNPRVAGRSREAYVELMNNLGLPLPEGIQEALQPNQTEIEAAAIHFPTLAQLNSGAPALAGRSRRACRLARPGRCCSTCASPRSTQASLAISRARGSSRCVSCPSAPRRNSRLSKTRTSW